MERVRRCVSTARHLSLRSSLRHLSFTICPRSCCRPFGIPQFRASVGTENVRRRYRLTRTNDLTNSTPVKKNKLWVIESHRPRPGTATNNPGPDLYTVGGFDPARRPLYEARPPGAPGGTRDSPAGRPPPALRRAPPRSRRRLRGAGAAAGPARVASAARDRSPAVARYVPANAELRGADARSGLWLCVRAS